MRRTIWSILLAAGVAACGRSSDSALRGPDSAAARFVASYGPATPEFAEFRDGLIENRYLDSIADRLTDLLRIPRNLTLATGHCVEPSASYDPAVGRVTLCYELFETLSRRFAGQEGLEYLVAGTVTFALMHELAHALIDVLALPITGREEDAADQLATLLLLEQGVAGDSLAFGAVGWLASNAGTDPLDDIALAAEHGPVLQRAYNVVCWIYGRDSTRYPELTREEWLPEFRRRRCPGEWTRMQGSWRRLLAPFRKPD